MAAKKFVTTLKDKLPPFVPGIAMEEKDDGYLVFERRQTSADSYQENYYWAPSQSLALALCGRSFHGKRRTD